VICCIPPPPGRPACVEALAEVEEAVVSPELQPLTTSATDINVPDVMARCLRMYLLWSARKNAPAPEWFTGLPYESVPGFL
jgi:hypothetical protein